MTSAAAIVDVCESCGSPHLGPKPCGLSFLQRLRSVRLDPSATPSKTMSMWDRDAVADQFGPDAREQMMEETKGIGPRIFAGQELSPDEEAFMVGEDRDPG